jgi:hypothetical protein
MNLLPRLALNSDPTDLSLPSNWDNRHEPGVSSYKDTSPVGLGPHPFVLIIKDNFNYLFKGPLSKYSHIGVRASTYDSQFTP